MEINKDKAPVLAALFAVFAAGLQACRKDGDERYEIAPVTELPPSAGKAKLKTEDQYVAVLYTNLFQKAISVKTLGEATDAILSLGDKELAHELIVSNFMNYPGVLFPTNEEMRKDLDKFLEETYKRFLVRNITEAERAYFKNYITNNPEVTPEHVYVAFALCNEYLFY